MKNLRQSPARENVEDHIATARRCLESLGFAWRESLASRSFVLHLAKTGFIEFRADPRGGTGGNAQRMTPASYHRFLKILAWKTKGFVSRHGHRVGLWVCGYDFPIEDVRKSLLVLMERIRRICEKDVGGIGRLDAPFHGKFIRYQRKLDKIRDGILFPELGPLLEPLLGWFLGYPYAKRFNVDLDTAYARMYAENPPSESDKPLWAALRRLEPHFRSGTAVSAEEQAATLADIKLSCRTKWGALIGSLAFGIFKFVLPQFLRSVAGPDGSPRLTLDRLTRIIERAELKHFTSARRWYLFITAGKKGFFVQHFKSRKWLWPLAKLFAEHWSFMRTVARQEPPFSGFIYSPILADEMPEVD